ncbi:hypothetical protein Y032_0387g453 [Ancylostoma ceylanicum]|uniref:Ephrin RBD domain-containing protein n=2 Tax=Ancylostoma ceylanicum TaxID=53326 RepID=A0A016RTG1_9BILA|nr:hypothetical protein Y032_0387g453 [Ancylostoma ceylanicum]
MRGCIFIISFFLGLCGYQTSPPSPWPPWPIMWNLSRNEYEDDANIQRVVYIHFNSTSDFLVHCRNPLVRYGYVDAQQIESKYQRKLCYNNDYSMICRRNKSLRTDSNWVTRALNDATNIRMVECLKPLFLNKMSHSLILRRYKRSMINGSETVFKENASMTLPPIPSAQIKSVKAKFPWVLPLSRIVVV